ncbi:methyltransferase, FkbM family [Palleronia salina]|uniref:Methyltransferase, FkbM family n=1 Tax=Palleronia salina TaxID=313368 RepID=A0A1M6FYM2_9RHOB|nr:FkbM family methyltransferase [Palleronia salina]SHJ02845.1 methyltransferase, FkbM family [Palleronia salina]
MSDTKAAQPEKSRAELRAEKMIRKQERNMRAAEARGFLAGVCAVLRPGDIVMDLGANLGEVTAPLAETGAHVVAYEPDPWTFGQLRDRFDGTDNVELVNAAVGATSGTVRLMRAENFDDNPEGASVKATIVGGGRSIDAEASVEVPLLSFADEVARLTRGDGRIAFCKMDIEGAELDILEDIVARKSLDPVQTLVAETHENKFKALRPRFRALRDAAAEAYPRRRLNLDWI